MKDLKQYSTDYFWSAEISKTLLNEYYYKAKQIETRVAGSGLQQRGDIDRVCGKDGKKWSVEEKIVNGKYPNILIETHSTYPTTAGWIETGKADVLLWVFAPVNGHELTILEIDFQKLKHLYQTQRDHFNRTYIETIEPTQRRTRCLMVPISDLKKMSVLLDEMTINMNEQVPTKKAVVTKIRGGIKNVENNGKEG